MASRIRRLGVLVALTAVMLLAMVLLALSYSEVGITNEIGLDGILLTSDFSGVPQTVSEDATELAMELFGDSREKYDAFVDQLLTAYVEARDKDFIVVFNSGGWGWNLLDRSPGWHSILTGIESELDDLGYTSVMLNYRRTSDTVRGRTKEFVEVVTNYPTKAKDLARRVEFLTAHIPDLKVIVAGESNGTVISDCAMSILQDNPQVYSIRTGPPFWHKTIMLERTLLLSSNGLAPDTFSEGDIPVMLWVSLKDWLGFSQADEVPGTIMRYLRAPGHDYSWNYPLVSFQITGFLEESFGIKKQ